jgi:hypothetical protein
MALELAFVIAITFSPCPRRGVMIGAFVLFEALVDALALVGLWCVGAKLKAPIF